MTNISLFLSKYKVFLSGLAASIAVALNQLLSSSGHSQDLKVYLFAGLMAALSYVSTQWRGQGVTILGIVGTLSGVFVTMQQTGNFTWNQFIMFSVAAILSSVAPPAKPLSYEKNSLIVDAKEVPPLAPVKDNSKLPIGGDTPK